MKTLFEILSKNLFELLEIISYLAMVCVIVYIIDFLINKIVEKFK